MEYRLCVTDGGRVGLAPSSARLGDLVAILLGCSVPVLLRKAENQDEWVFVGECYLDGVMHGEVLGESKDEGWTKQNFALS